MSEPLARGRSIADLLAGSWRPDPAALPEGAIAWEPLVPALLELGCAGLAWNRLRAGSQRVAPSAQPLLAEYRVRTLLAGRLEARLLAAAGALDTGGIEYLVVKGWAVARWYAEKGLRPYGDLDLCVNPREYARAVELLSRLEDDRIPIDLHAGYPKLYDRTAADLRDGTSSETLHGAPVRVPAPEEHLRLVCFHLWAHGAVRPVWLCDIAAVVEGGGGPAFDWDRCLRGKPRYTDWVISAIGLAGRLLGARLDDTPIPPMLERLPGWLEPEVLRQWGRKPTPVTARGPLDALRLAWRNRMQAAYELRLPFRGLPALPVQLLALAARLPAHLANRLSGAGSAPDEDEWGDASLPG